MNSRAPEPRDLFIIGGGINGCGIARDAAGRGYSVTLAEMNDLGSGTSSWSTKLIHGGLRYLEFYEFRLVREALQEREVLWAMAPHIIRPLRFVLPHHAGLRPRWMLRLGLFIYDHLGGRKRLPPARALDLTRDPAGAALKDRYKRGFEYSDCWVDDARLVVLNAMDAAARGADIRVRTRVVAARRDGGLWRVELEDLASGERRTVHARMLVNAAGPWVDGVLASVVGRNGAHNVRLVQGSHIVVRRLFDHERCYIFQNADGRVVFAIPYERHFTLIGTTDQDYEGDPGNVRISPAEIDYLRTAASDYFKQPITADDVVWTYSGVRPLFDDGASKAQEATRDYVLSVEGEGEGALINIFGGKLTTYRRLSEAVMSRISTLAGRRDERWTAGSVLPGGDFPPNAFQATADELGAAYPFLDAGHASRLCRLYGTRAWTLLGAARTLDELGTRFGGDLYEAEVRYLVEHEWARSADDILWRRSKLGLLLTQAEQAALANWLDGRPEAAEAGERRG